MPLAMHVDAGPISKKSSAKIVQWSSLTGAGEVCQRHFLACSWVPKHHRGANAAWAALDQSFRAMRLGVWPEGEGEPGQPLAGQWKACLLFIKADNEGLSAYLSCPCTVEAGRSTIETKLMRQGTCVATPAHPLEACKSLVEAPAGQQSSQPARASIESLRGLRPP